ncbi:MAG: glycoside hydrolase family 27 protein [Chitinivibrionales bacterium]|nr:glycoside hydrolase family 27 protein [Chitinivibrionales bacterium]
MAPKFHREEGSMSTTRTCTSVAAAFLLLVTAQSAVSLDNGLARTPPMGWASWNAFLWMIDEAKITGNADAMVSTGLRDAGYEYMLVDLGWQAYAAGAMRARFPDSTIKHDAGKFPNGMQYLADYIRSKGLRYAAYTDVGYETCGDMTEGSREFEYKDMATFAGWGADYVKIDWCGADGRDARSVYSLFKNAIEATGRPMVFSLCCWGQQNVHTWGNEVGNLWRISGDIEATWESVMSIVDRAMSWNLVNYHGPGGWNDLDMLQVGNGDLTLDENRAHFSLWCMFASPLMVGTDLRSVSDDIVAILTNPEVIAVNQDSLGLMCRKVAGGAEQQVFAKLMQDSSYAVLLLNRGTASATMTANWEDVGLQSGDQALVRDLWERADKGMHTGSYSAEVPSHGVVMLEVTRADLVKTVQSSDRSGHRSLAPALRGLDASPGDRISVVDLRGAVVRSLSAGRNLSALRSDLAPGSYLVVKQAPDGATVLRRLRVAH